MRRTLLVRTAALAVGLALLGARAGSETPECAMVEVSPAAVGVTPDVSLPTQSELTLRESPELPALTF